MAEYVLREMKQEDVPVIAEMEKACFSMPWSQQSIQGELDNPQALWCVLETQDKAVAYGGLWMIVDEAHVTNVAVLPEYRRRGYGRAVMEELIRQAKAGGAERMTLEVRLSNMAAEQLYFSLGFMPVGIRPGYYADTGEDALILWKEGL